MKEEAIIKNISKHITLDEEEKKYFISILHYKKLERGKILLMHGDVARSQYFVISGCLSVIILLMKMAKNILLLLHLPIGGFLIYTVIITETPAEHIIDTLIPTEVFEISKSDMEEVYVRIPKFERFFRILFQNAIVSQMSRIRQVISVPAEERYKAFIKQYPGIYEQIPLKVYCILFRHVALNF